MPERPLAPQQRPVLQRVPPHDLSTEANLLSTALFSIPAAQLIASLEPDDFYSPAHRHIQAAVTELVAAGSVVDGGTVGALLRSQGLLDAAGGIAKIQELHQGIASSASAGRLADHVRRYARQRRMLTKLSEAVDAIYRGDVLEGLLAEVSAEAEAEATERESSWDPVNLAAVLAGEGDEPDPAVLQRSDGVALLYPGKVHTLNAEPTAGKSWVALAACAQEIGAGRHALYVDFEDDAASVTARLLELGLGPADILDRFHYVHPDDPLDNAARLRLVALTEALRPSVAVVDGVTEALALNGWRSNVDVEVAAFFGAIPRTLARCGAAVLVLDHVTKDKENRGRWGIGSQHKLAGVGATFGLEAVKPFSRGCSGMSRMVVFKDRAGRVQPHAVAQKLIAEVHIISTEEGRRVEVNVTAPTTEGGGEFRPTGYMERVSRALETWPDGVTPTLNAVRRAVHGRGPVIDTALRMLMSEGYVAVDPGPKRSILHRSVKPFREVEETDESDDSYDAEEEF